MGNDNGKKKKWAVIGGNWATGEGVLNYKVVNCINLAVDNQYT